MQITRITPEASEPEVTRPEPDRLISGDPVHTTWNHTDDRGLYCGIWQSTPGVWRVTYDEWEYCRILSGVSKITSDDGTEFTVSAGHSFTIPSGFSGVWEVIETTRKDYVILLRD
jgi:uncharacterized cupin superfamily protein